jgi:dihydrofolate synthase / folylpolyglutamate synthase
MPMKNTASSKTKENITARQRGYNEIIELLDSRWSSEYKDQSHATLKQLDMAFNAITTKIDIIAIAGSNGKSLTAHFTSKLLQEEGLKVGTLYAPHILTYNERFSINNESIPNKVFTDLGNEVLNTADTLGLTPHTSDILLIMGLLYFRQSQIDVALVEVTQLGMDDPLTYCTPKILAITRITPESSAPEAPDQADVETLIEDMIAPVKQDTYVVSADQSKLNLQTMQSMVAQKGAIWAMPIRKLASLGYPYEQTYGRSAALGERVASIYINSFANNNALVVANSLLTKAVGQRGRPTLDEKKRQLENPKKTLEQFWKETACTLPAHFQVLDKEKPTIMLDVASNVDAFANILLGIRLLHYQRSLKDLTIILGCNNEQLNMDEFLRQFRYFFKKTSGKLVVCPVNPLPGHRGTRAWDVEKVANDLRNMKINATATSSFAEAFDIACKSVNERTGFVVVTGSPSIVTEYWRLKGIKKLGPAS